MEPRTGQYAAAVPFVGILTVTAVLSVRAPDNGPALLGQAAATAFAVWCLAASGPAALAVLNPGWAVTLLLRRRLGAAALLPAWAAAAVAAGAFAVLGGWLIGELPQLLVQPEPGLVPAALILMLASVTGAWAVDVASSWAGSGALLTAAAVLVAGTALPPAYTAALNPAVIFGLGVSGIASWTYVYVGALALLTGAVIGGLTAALIVPDVR